MKLQKINLQFFASKKGVGSTKNGRDSKPKYLGMKKSDGQRVLSGQIIYCQKGTKVYPGKNVGLARNFTLFAKVNGVVKYTKFLNNKTKVSVITSH